MARNEVDPIIEGNEEQYTIKHPAYGLVRITHPTGGGVKMFGSDLVHNERVRLEFQLAEEDRHLSNSWINERGRVLEVELTHAQWAAMVSSSMGSPTPVTYRYYRDGNIKHIPEIGKQDTEKEKAAREYARKIADTLEKGTAILNKLDDLAAKGKAGKKDIDELRNLVQQSLGRFKSDTTFAVNCFEESLETLVTEAQIEVESTIAAMAKRIGAEHLGLSLDKNLLEDKK